MATVIPFKAWRYNLNKVRMELVVAPPYDVISPAEQETLYGRDPHNIVKIELGKEEPGDNGSINKYERAARCWQDWIRSSLVRQDEKPGFYLYENQFLDPESGQKHRRFVVFGLIRLEPFEAKIVLPHEKTHAGPKEDRLKLLTATRTNFSPVFGLYKDPDRVVSAVHARRQSAPPLCSFDLETGERYTLWQISDSSDVHALSQMFQSKTILIADGHHRYETALRYRSIHQSGVRRQSGSPSAFDYALMGLVEMSDEGLLIFPIHRIIRNLKPLQPESFLVQLSELFEIQKTDHDQLERIAKGSARGTFGIQIGGQSFTARLKDKTKALKEMPAGKPESWYQLEVAQISHLVLPRLGIRDDSLEKYLDYTKSFREAIAETVSKKAAVSFIVPPIPASVIQEICAAGELMPQKSTYFYPKLGSGILMYRHDD